eukprot:708812-Amphidinium_carterae.2
MGSDLWESSLLHDHGNTTSFNFKFGSSPVCRTLPLEVLKKVSESVAVFLACLTCYSSGWWGKGGRVQ